jgi:hypothetical protein
VWTGSFDPTQDAVYVHGFLHGPVKARAVSSVLDTGAPTSYLNTASAREYFLSAGHPRPRPANVSNRDRTT